MRDSFWFKKKMVLPDGNPKGMKLVLQERGVNVKGMNAEKNERNFKYPNFINQKNILQEFVESKGHICIYFTAN